MHADEFDIDAALVEKLVAEQFPQWAGKTIARVASSGTDNAIFRLGDDLSVRMPRIPGAAKQIELEDRWLPRLAPHLPVAVSAPLAKGVPTAGYPWPWAIHPWLDGENPVVGQIGDPRQLAMELAAFVKALREIDTTGGPVADRGLPLASRDAYTRDAIARSEGLIDTAAVTKAWDAALAAPRWDRPPVWIHADLSPGNILVRDGHLTAVIDFAALGVGEPACDLINAWNLLPASVRADFRAAVDVADATWARARGWALSIAIIQLPYYKDTNPALAANSRHVLNEILAES
ncbi:aminoglycoside phosphotransferase family protein [Fodinicola acaciae]|uniref:aminoglycoside phosphotransferase family protein n=1 Tax=Fodinicola acaciae TaxID=2681555 RepID=UPI0013D73535|nr:aminoglycoside phosphotransferase family protein [Fodinicola acaciae]